MDFDPLIALIDECGTVAVRTHENADADAVGSGLALTMALRDLGKEPGLSAPSVSKLGRILAGAVCAEVTSSERPPAADLLIFVDDRPAPGTQAGRHVAVIDHHEGRLETEVSFCYIDPAFTSTSEMVFELLADLVHAGRLAGISSEMGRLLLGGTIADTGGFRLATTATMERVLRIAAMSGVEPRDVFPILRTPQDPSLRIACLKGASRLAIRSTRECLIVTTTVSSFQGDVASSLLGLGADLAFAGGSRKGMLSVSGRARNELCDAGLSLAEVMTAVAGRIGGEGGGHAGAAALRGHGDLDQILDLCVRETRKRLRAIQESS